MQRWAPDREQDRVHRQVKPDGEIRALQHEVTELALIAAVDHPTVTGDGLAHQGTKLVPRSFWSQFGP